MALDLEPPAGADSLLVKIFLVDSTGRNLITIKGGIVEILMYEGQFDKSVPESVFHKWVFDATYLKKYQFNSTVGPGYELLLTWSPKLITNRFITLIACYHNHKGRRICSRPTTTQAITVDK